jgi:NADH dehydrogenase FAD-containing subunit
LAAESWTRFRDIPALKSPNFKIIQGSVSKVDCTTKVAHITDTATKSTITEPYDYLIVASGLRRAYPTVPKSLGRDEFLEEARKHTESVRNAQGVVVVGGGTHHIPLVAPNVN